MLAVLAISGIVSSCSCSTGKTIANKDSPAVVETFQAKRKRLDAVYAAKEPDCARQRAEAAFLSRNGRDASLPETSAAACEQEIADYREAMLHWEDMFAPIDEFTWRLKFPMDSVRYESHMDFFLILRQIQRVAGDAHDTTGESLPEMQRALGLWEEGKRKGFVVELPAGTPVTELAYHYRDAGKNTDRSLVFTMTTGGHSVYMPFWIKP